MSDDSTSGSQDTNIPTPEIYKCCDNPQITYNAPVNINIEERTIGSVDAVSYTHLTLPTILLV